MSVPDDTAHENEVPEPEWQVLPAEPVYPVEACWARYALTKSGAFQPSFETAYPGGGEHRIFGINLWH